MASKFKPAVMRAADVSDELVARFVLVTHRSGGYALRTVYRDGYCTTERCSETLAHGNDCFDAAVSPYRVTAEVHAG